MQIEKKIISLEAKDVPSILLRNYQSVMSSFYEMQSGFFRSHYKIHKSLESACIILSFNREVHLQILRQREKNLDHNVSLNNFWVNLSSITNPGLKIISIVKATNIPKETARRKIKKLIENGYLYNAKNREYFLNLKDKTKENVVKLMNEDVSRIARFVGVISKSLDLKLDNKKIENEIKSQFSFYWFHFLTCQLSWFKLWQSKLNDIDLIFIAIQALIPSLKFSDSTKNLNIDNLHAAIGKTNPNYKSSKASINASSISDISGIPRATCIRKLEKLVQLGFLVREIKSKRYFINQFASSRSKYLMKKEYIFEGLEIYSNFLSIVINAINRTKN